MNGREIALAALLLVALGIALMTMSWRPATVRPGGVATRATVTGIPKEQPRGGPPAWTLEGQASQAQEAKERRLRKHAPEVLSRYRRAYSEVYSTVSGIEVLAGPNFRALSKSEILDLARAISWDAHQRDNDVVVFIDPTTKGMIATVDSDGRVALAR
jgi:hypothetical protein